MGIGGSGSVWWFWDVRGYWSEGRAWLERLLAQRDQVGLSAAVRAKALYGLEVLVSATDSAAAHAIIKERLALFRDLDNRAGMAAAHNKLAGLARDDGDHIEAQTLGEERL